MSDLSGKKIVIAGGSGFLRISGDFDGRAFRDCRRNCDAPFAIDPESNRAMVARDMGWALDREMDRSNRRC